MLQWIQQFTAGKPLLALIALTGLSTCAGCAGGSGYTTCFKVF